MEVRADTLRFFRTPAALRRWLKSHHDRATELWIGMHRKDTGLGGIDYRQALDEALCWGWIDGIRKKIDDTSFAVRFTPRGPRSIWSNVNIAHIGRLTREGRMMPPGIAAFERMDPARAGVYSFERERADLEPGMIARFKTDAKAWKYFEAQPPYYRRIASWWIISAKKEETRERRLKSLISVSAKQTRLPSLTSTPRRKTG